MHIDNLTAPRAASAILYVLPLSPVDKPALRNDIGGKPNEIPQVQIEVQKEIDAAAGQSALDFSGATILSTLAEITYIVIMRSLLQSVSRA